MPESDDGNPIRQGASAALTPHLHWFHNLKSDEEVLKAFADSGLMVVGRPSSSTDPRDWLPEDRGNLKRTFDLTTDDEVDEVLSVMSLVTMVVGDLSKAARETPYPLLVAKAVGGLISGLEAQLRQVVPILRQRGCSWTQIGGALGISKQSAWERFSGED